MRFRELLARCASGLVLGTMVSYLGRDLGLSDVPPFRTPHFFELWQVFGVLLGLAGGKRWLIALVCALTAGFVLVSYTPFVPSWAPGFIVAGRLNPALRADAIVVLKSGIKTNGELVSVQQTRLVHGYELVRQGLAPRLVLTRLSSPNPSHIPAVDRQMRALGFSFPVMELGPILNTHDEARAVSSKAAQEGWKSVILVTEPYHTRRAVAVFAATGLIVRSSLLTTAEIDYADLRHSGARRSAFRYCLKELVGYETYRRRGWLGRSGNEQHR
jgi:uncharacterized SAM-binding protein YcdF (DUF218 family)